MEEVIESAFLKSLHNNVPAVTENAKRHARFKKAYRNEFGWRRFFRRPRFKPIHSLALNYDGHCYSCILSGIKWAKKRGLNQFTFPFPASSIVILAVKEMVFAIELDILGRNKLITIDEPENSTRI